jgi:hypothetical protein
VVTRVNVVGLVVLRRQGGYQSGRHKGTPQVR